MASKRLLRYRFIARKFFFGFKRNSRNNKGKESRMKQGTGIGDCFDRRVREVIDDCREFFQDNFIDVGTVHCPDPIVHDRARKEAGSEPTR